MQFEFSIKWAGQGSRNVRFHRLHAGKYYTVLKAMTGAGYGAPSSWAELQTTRAVNCHTGTVKDVKSSESRRLSVVGCGVLVGTEELPAGDPLPKRLNIIPRKNGDLTILLWAFFFNTMHIVCALIVHYVNLLACPQHALLKGKFNK